MFTSRARITLAGTGIAVALLVAGCSSDSGSSASGTTHEMADMPGMSPSSTSSAAATRTDFNAADVTFLQMMYPHHAQAVEMAKLVPSRSQNQQLIALASKIEAAQAPEMTKFAELLHSFGKPAPSATMDHPMGGVMSQDQMTALRQASGAAFDKMWLQMMIEHHQGAVTMSNTELSGGSNAEVKALAQGIVTAQQAEIQQMRGMTQS
ncbi:DUF305 domain-containing protein [Nocardia macrotermitis]|uniref:DUF305 domain-containing protein n=1 Tax=Nocardia macrotermitis TaxID=2585198 RepID=A0A7K0D1Y4_9NOCA|nr:DUF305 domain-containing protein [Nocardia macrotermitis]MQY19733.1 hypothetical protein [Nocardia macrotermitis]